MPRGKVGDMSGFMNLFKLRSIHTKIHFQPDPTQELVWMVPLTSMVPNESGVGREYNRGSPNFWKQVAFPGHHFQNLGGPGDFSGGQMSIFN